MASQYGRGDPAARWAGFFAAACFLAALVAFGAMLDGYSHARWPVALLGAAGVPRAAAFNLLAFIVPGLLAAFVLLRRRGSLARDAAWPLGLGWTLALLAALAFAAQGLLPLDAASPDAGRGRLHGVAWGIWGIAFAAAGLALAVGTLRMRQGWRALVHAGAGGLVFTLGWLAGDALPLALPLAQRLAFGAWFAWLAWVAWGRRERG